MKCANKGALLLDSVLQLRQRNQLLQAGQARLIYNNFTSFMAFLLQH